MIELTPARMSQNFCQMSQLLNQWRSGELSFERCAQLWGYRMEKLAPYLCCEVLPVPKGDFVVSCIRSHLLFTWEKFLDSVVEDLERNWNEKFFAALDRRSRVHFGLTFSPLGKLSLYGPFIELWTVGGLMELYEYPHVDPTFYVLDTLEVVGTYPAHSEQ